MLQLFKCLPGGDNRSNEQAAAVVVEQVPGARPRETASKVGTPVCIVMFQVGNRIVSAFKTLNNALQQGIKLSEQFEATGSSPAN